ncbi:MAG: poly-gamma-glutamate synthesis protein (capsule biosynthesis protein) [Parcubacteria group bacterium Gr01-1014_20]|nr:MAG: poly-gamma-glutamate synthesis protein (capsule biosynthesis protein) [Parcubacteria group bacterium Gr01-1014_20]
MKSGYYWFFVLVGFAAFYSGFLIKEIRLVSDKPEGFSGGIADLQSVAVNKKSEKIETTLIFVGDIMLGRGVEWKISKNSSDFHLPFLKVKDYLRQADLVFGNLEGPISDRGKNQGSIYSFRFKPEVALALKDAGFGVLSLANNHIWDWGAEAISDTLSNLAGVGIGTVGAGRNYEEANQAYFYDVKNLRVAFLAYTNLYPNGLAAEADSSGVSDFDLEKIRERVEEVKSRADLVVVSLHWGEEYKTNASDWQKKTARSLVDAGADVVVGHHPHVPQEVEEYEGSWIFYSLGNFVFDQGFSEETMGGMSVELKVTDKKITNVKPVKFKINSDFQPYLPE